MVFTATEKANIAKNDTINRLKQYEWDGKENYVGLYFGDGEGNSNDYGQTIYLQDNIYRHYTIYIQELELLQIFSLVLSHKIY